MLAAAAVHRMAASSDMVTMPTVCLAVWRLLPDLLDEFIFFTMSGRVSPEQDDKDFQDDNPCALNEAPGGLPFLGRSRQTLRILESIPTNLYRMTSSRVA